MSSPVSFSTPQTPTTSSDKSVTFNPTAPIPDFTTAFASPEKYTDNSLKKYSAINVYSYNDSAYEKSKL